MSVVRTRCAGRIPKIRTEIMWESHWWSKPRPVWLEYSVQQNRDLVSTELKDKTDSQRVSWYLHTHCGIYKAAHSHTWRNMHVCMRVYPWIWRVNVAKKDTKPKETLKFRGHQKCNSIFPRSRNNLKIHIGNTKDSKSPNQLKAIKIMLEGSIYLIQNYTAEPNKNNILA